MAGEGEVIFEFHRMGSVVKVTAVDAATGTEVAIVGDPNAGEAVLRRLALQKLRYVMARKSGDR